MTRYVARCVLALLLGVAPGYAQQGTTEVRGRVLDPQGAVLPGVTVTVRNQDTGMFRETVSSADGTFFVGGIVPERLAGGRGATPGVTSGVGGSDPRWRRAT